jgi:large subunit ribosomal protein L25
MPGRSPNPIAARIHQAMAPITLSAQPRTETGNGPARRLRQQGLVPGVLYDHPNPGIIFAVDHRELRRALGPLGGREGVIELTIGDDSPRSVRMVDWYLDPVRGDIKHIDFRPAD